MWLEFVAPQPCNTRAIDFYFVIECIDSHLCIECVCTLYIHTNIYKYSCILGTNVIFNVKETCKVNNSWFSFFCFVCLWLFSVVIISHYGHLHHWDSEGWHTQLPRSFLGSWNAAFTLDGGHPHEHCMALAFYKWMVRHIEWKYMKSISST